MNLGFDDNKDGSDDSELGNTSPYKLCTLILISEYFFKPTENNTARVQRVRTKRNLFREEIQPNFRKDFAMMLLHLIVCIDKSFDDFIKFVFYGKYQLPSDIKKNLENQLNYLSKSTTDTTALIEAVRNVELLISNQNLTEIYITKGSPTGCFIKRVQLYFDKLEFNEVKYVFTNFQNYLKSGKRYKLKKNILNQEDEHTAKPLDDCSNKMDITDASQSSVNFDKDLTSPSCNSTNLEVNNSGKSNIISGWSKRQSELFLRNQAMLIANDLKVAMNPKELQGKIKDILATSKDHVTAHYLSYLNCLQSKEYCGAMDNLLHYFDRKNTIYNDEETIRCRLRYSALNLAILHCAFDMKKNAFNFLKESIKLALQTNDDVCLQHAQAWICKLIDEHNSSSLERAIAKCKETTTINTLASYNNQYLTQQMMKSGEFPAKVFEVLSESDSINNTNLLKERHISACAQKAALWVMYGYSDIASVYYQQLLYYSAWDMYDHHLTEISIALNFLAYYFTLQGEYQLAWCLVSYAKTRFTQCKYCLWSENLLYFTESLYRGLWQHAQVAINQLSTVDNFEALLRLSELKLVLGDNKEAMEAAQQVLNQTECPVFKTRAVYMMAKADPINSIISLCEGIKMANFYSLNYWQALMGILYANIQLELGMPTQALKIIEECQPCILAQNCFGDMADSMLTYAKCKLNEKLVGKVDALCLLECFAEPYATKVDDYSRLRQIYFLQSIMYHKSNMIKERNTYASKFRKLDELLN